MRVRALAAGETITVEDISGHSHPWMVFGPCEHRSVGYYCSVHSMHMANVGNLLMELEGPGKHVIAVWCGTCRLYRACDQAQLDALVPRPDPVLPHGVSENG